MAATHWHSKERTLEALRNPTHYAKKCAYADRADIMQYGYADEGSDWEADQALDGLRKGVAYEPGMEAMNERDWCDAFKRSYAETAARIFEGDY